MAGTGLDPETLKQKQQLIGGYTTGLFQAGIIYVGRETGLFAGLADGGHQTAQVLGSELGLHPRFVLEWLRAAAAGGLVEYDGDDRFSLLPEVAHLLVDGSNLGSLQWFFVNLPHRVGLWESVPESFRTGLGIDWDSRGAPAITMMETGFRAWYEQVLVQRALPALDGVVPRLETGARVADLGCGAGIALIEMARAYPRSQFHGYDLSRNALARARENGAAAKLQNLAFHQVPDDRLPDDSSFDLITTFDCMHDMTRPFETAGAIRAALTADGAWFIADINSFPTFEENLASNPASARFYAVSVFGCLQSAMSEPNGAGLGTFGLPEPKMRELATNAGFTRFRRVDLPSPVNAYYEARP